MNRKKCWHLLILLFPMLSPWLMAQNGGPILPGSASVLDKIVWRSDTIVVAKLVTLGLTTPDAPGRADYNSARIQVTSILKGSANQNLTVSINVHHSKGRIEEIAPEEGKEYLFFIHTDEAKREIVLKILPATDDNIAKVQALIAAAPAPK